MDGYPNTIKKPRETRQYENITPSYDEDNQEIPEEIFSEFFSAPTSFSDN